MFRIGRYIMSSKQSTKRPSSSTKRCLFCGRSEEQTRGMIGAAEQGVLVCDRCALDMVRAFAQGGIYPTNPLRAEDQNSKQQAQPDLPPRSKLPKPTEINQFLDQYVIGQTQAKKVLSVAVYNHYKRISQEASTDTSNDVEISKSNIIMVGPTGTGKTLLAQTIARMLHVPFAMVDATVLTQAGYVGEDIESVLTRLLQNANYDAARAEKGIVFIDEIDKIARKGDNPSITRDVSGEGVQQGLLKLLEGSIINVPPEGGRKHPEQKFVQINTKDILFICAGAFDGIERRIAARLNTSVVGYSQQAATAGIKREHLLQYISHQDLKSYGLIPEIIGRLPVLTALDPLDVDALKRILTDPKNAITKQYKKLMEMDGIALSFPEETLDFIAQKAIDNKMGARGLRSIVETIMVDAMYELPSSSQKSLTVTPKYAAKKLQAGT